MGIVHDAVVEYIRFKAAQHDAEWKARHPEGQTKLNVSDLGWCVRKAYLPLFGIEPTHPFDDYAMSVIDSGNVWGERNMLGTSFSSIARRDWAIIRPAQPRFGAHNESGVLVSRLFLSSP